jgi:copper chaperone CopZ
MAKVNYSIPAIHCNHCAMTIKVELGDVAGVKDVTVDVDQKSAEVTYTDPATEEQLLEVLTEIGYPVVG